MDFKIRKIVESHILDYLKLKYPAINFAKKSFRCPCSEEHDTKEDNTASLFPPNSFELHCSDPKHGKFGNIFDMFRRLETDMKDMPDDDIADYLIHLLNIKTDEQMMKLLTLYSDAGFCLIPLRKQNQGDDSKKALQIGWEKTEYKDIRMWLDWLKSGAGVGLNLGRKSNCVALDIDSDPTYEKVKDLLGDTLVQTTSRGRHFIYEYDSDFDHINHSNLRSKGYEMEIRANNAYVVIAPTSVQGESREWNYKKINAMPKELKELLLSLVEKKPEETVDENIQKCIDNEKIDVIDLSGKRNDTFVKLAGILRKKLNRQNLAYVIDVISNNLIDKPIPTKEKKGMLAQVEKYNTFDKKDIADKILKHLDKTTQTTARDLNAVLGYDLADLHEALHYLMQEEKIFQVKNVYHLVEKIEWTTEFLDKSKLLPFKVPYFEEFATFRCGDLVVIGGMPGTGKTHVAMNFVRQFANQGQIPNYFPTEAGSRWAKIAIELGLKEGDFRLPKAGKGVSSYDPAKIELEDEAITIVDWILPKNYAETDKLYEALVNQLTRHGGLLIAFAQLKKDGTWFAENMIDMFASFGVKYMHQKEEKGQYNNEQTYFETCKIRETKVGKQYLTIPTKFDKNTKTLELR